MINEMDRSGLFGGGSMSPGMNGGQHPGQHSGQQSAQGGGLFNPPPVQNPPQTQNVMGTMAPHSGGGGGGLFGNSHPQPGQYGGHGMGGQQHNNPGMGNYQPVRPRPQLNLGANPYGERQGYNLGPHPGSGGEGGPPSIEDPGFHNPMPILSGGRPGPMGNPHGPWGGNGIPTNNPMQGPGPAPPPVDPGRIQWEKEQAMGQTAPPREGLPGSSLPPQGGGAPPGMTWGNGPNGPGWVKTPTVGGTAPMGETLPPNGSGWSQAPPPPPHTQTIGDIGYNPGQNNFYSGATGYSAPGTQGNAPQSVWNTIMNNKLGNGQPPPGQLFNNPPPGPPPPNPYLNGYLGR